MTTATKAALDGNERVTPYLCVSGAAKAIAFYVEAFGAKESYRLTGPDGRIGHAEIEIGKATIMLSDEHPEYGVVGPERLGGSPVSLHLTVADVDAFVARAVAAGAKLERPIQDQFYGDRTGVLRDPFGHKWHIATRKEHVSPQEMQRRFDAMVRGG